MATFSPRYRRPWRPASQLPPSPGQVKQVRQLYLSSAFTQQERDDLGRVAVQAVRPPVKPYPQPSA